MHPHTKKTKKKHAHRYLIPDSSLPYMDTIFVIEILSCPCRIKEELGSGEVCAGIIFSFLEFYQAANVKLVLMVVLEEKWS